MDQGPEDITPEHVLHSAAARLLDVQVETYHALDTRNANIISVSGTVLPLAFGLLAIREQEIPATAEKALAGAVVCYALVLIFAWLISRIDARISPSSPHAARACIPVFGSRTPAMGCERICQRNHRKRDRIAAQGATYRMGEHAAVSRRSVSRAGCRFDPIVIRRFVGQVADWRQER